MNHFRGTHIMQQTRLKRWGIAAALALCFFAISRPGGARAAESMLSHLVQPGDTLLDLTLYYHIPLSMIEENNELAVEVPRPVGAGQQLGIPVGFVIPLELLADGDSEVAYTVLGGDTLGELAKRFGIPAEALAEANEIGNMDRIFTGQELIIPTDDEEIIALVEAYEPVSPTCAATDVPQPTLAEGKQILVVLSQQCVYAFEDGELLKIFLVSTGLPGTPTVQGDYAIYYKVDSQRMTGPGYDLPGVPWVSYFYKGYSFHGTYWHNNFGHPMSHGCVNMFTPDSEWLYRWAPVGTAVRVIY
jgi:lipoprotein-anchoring transpeptidase ErfK/SrfK